MPNRTLAGDDHWRMRRRMLFGSSLFYAVVIGYCLWKGLDTAVADTATSMSFFGLMTNVTVYVFGAAWEDISTGRFSLNPKSKEQ